MIQSTSQPHPEVIHKELAIANMIELQYEVIEMGEAQQEEGAVVCADVELHTASERQVDTSQGCLAVWINDSQTLFIFFHQETDLPPMVSFNLQANRDQQMWRIRPKLSAATILSTYRQL